MQRRSLLQAACAASVLTLAACSKETPAGGSSSGPAATDAKPGSVAPSIEAITAEATGFNVGSSMVTKVAPARTVSTMMGVWYLSSFFGNYAAGFFGSFYSVMAKDRFFGMLAIAGIITGCVFFLIRRPVVKVMQTET